MREVWSEIRHEEADMAGRVAPSRFHEGGWRVLAWAAAAHYRTASLAEGVRLVEAIGRLADGSGQRPEIDLRPTGVSVRLFVDDTGALTEADLALAGRISSAARDLGAQVDPTRVQFIQIAIDALVISDVRPFWEAVLGYRPVGDEDLIDPRAEGPTIWFQQMDAPRPQRNRIHIDLYLPQDQAEARIAAALEAGGRIVSDANAPEWWTLADPEGNEVDVAPWPDQEPDS
jgi:4a-hydroxytetrahydrobiopterin dehydratase